MQLSGQRVSAALRDTERLALKFSRPLGRSGGDRRASVRWQPLRCSLRGDEAWSYPESVRSKAFGRVARRARSERAWPSSALRTWQVGPLAPDSLSGFRAKSG